MKTLDQIQKARTTLIYRIVDSEGLNDEQTCMLFGMLNALVWVADGPNCSTMERVLAGESFVARPSKPA